MSCEIFCSENQVPETLVDTEVLNELLNITSVADVIRSALFHKENKQSLLKLYKKAQTSGTDRHWMTPAVTKPLLNARETHQKQPFDGCPIYLIHFVVSSNGDAQFQNKLRLLHTVMYDRLEGTLL
jgi:hypothetical protein